MSVIRKTICLPKKQDKFLKKNSISLSRFVQKKLKEKMEAEGKPSKVRPSLPTKPTRGADSHKR